jgi:preprotein translocase subunit YajC
MPPWGAEANSGSAATHRNPSMNPAILLQQPANPLQNPLTPIILMVVIFYLVLFLPMRRRQRKADEMLKNLKNGDRVVTTGGVIGTIVALGDDNTLTLRIRPDNLKLQFARTAVTGLVESEEEKK